MDGPPREDGEKVEETFRFSPRPNRAREINWLPWGQEAFDRAAREGKPVLLSISAVWCHWCHVMDETTYSDQEVIDLVNSLYVPVRVDNDRNPDINRRYNQGGWPTTAFLSPRGVLLAGTTYLPPDTMRKVLRRISELYAENRNRLEADAVETTPGPRRHGALDESLVDVVASSLLAAWDREHGGLGWEPKFPHSDALLLALRMHSRGGGEYLDFAVHYLRSMAGGGLRDRVEGGFFRYSVTRDWSVPHYEKMLDDNARLLIAYLRAYGATGEDQFLAVAAETASFIYRTLSDGHQRFFGSQDADEEYYRMDAAARATATPPPVDETVYLDHSSRTASALLESASVLGKEEYRKLSLGFLDFAWRECYRPGEGMAHYHDGSPRRRGLLGDQVEAALAFQEAFSSTGEPGFLERAGELLDLVEEGFLDREKGLLLDAMEGFLPPGLRPEAADLAMVSRTAEALLRQAHLAGETRRRETAEALLSSVSGEAPGHGYFAAPFALALDLFLEGPLAMRWAGGEEGRRRLFLAIAALSPDSRTLFLPLHREKVGGDEGSQVEVCGKDACFLRSGDPEEVAAYLGVRPGIIVDIEKRESVPGG